LIDHTHEHTKFVITAISG